MDPPARKKSKVMDPNSEDNSYIPVQCSTAEGKANLSLIFSLKEEQGSLLNALRPFKVLKRHYHCQFNTAIIKDSFI